MIRPRHLIIVLLVLIFSALACGGAAPDTPAPADLGINLLVAVEGEVLLKRDGWLDFHPTGFGAALFRGDQLRLSSGAAAVVLCEDLSAWHVASGVQSGLNNGCPQTSEPQLVRDGSAIGNTRGGVDPLIPYIISPRSTKLLNPTPTLRWNPIPGAKSYSVRISGTDWQQEVTTTELVFPGDLSLQAGKDYLLIVESDKGKSSQDEGLPGLGFNLLRDEEAGRVRADTTTVDALQLSEEANSFALAQLYATHDLYAEAIEMLEQLVAAGNQSTHVHRTLGEMYQQVGVLALAEARYTSSLQLAEAADDLEGMAAARARLGEVYTALGNKDEAIRWLTQSQAGYESLGDSQRASQIAEQVAALNP